MFYVKHYFHYLLIILKLVFAQKLAEPFKQV
jgi:hypothetical protein